MEVAKINRQAVQSLELGTQIIYLKIQEQNLKQMKIQYILI